MSFLLSFFDLNGKKSIYFIDTLDIFNKGSKGVIINVHACIILMIKTEN